MRSFFKSRKIWRCGTLAYTASGVCTLFFLLLMGDFTWSLKERSVFQIVQLLFKEFGASDFLNGLLIVSLPAALGMILGPWVSYHSDRCRSRLGRRIPYILVTTPIAAGAMLGMAASPALGKMCASMLGVGEHTWVLIFLGGFWTVFEFATVIAGTLFGALVNDVVPPTLIGRFYGLFRALSLIAGILFNYFLLGYASTHYAALFISISVVYGGGFLLMCCRVKEGEYPPPEKASSPPSRIGALKEYFKESCTNPYYLFYFLFLAMTATAMSPFACYTLFYARSLNIPMDHYGKAISATYLISLILSWPIGYLADRLHPLRIALGTMALYAVIAFSGFYLVKDERTFLIFFIALIATAGLFYTGTASMSQRILPKENFATLASAAGVLCSLCHTMVVPIIGTILDWSGHRYEMTLLLGGILSLTTFLTGLLFYRQFTRRNSPDTE